MIFSKNQILVFFYYLYSSFISTWLISSLSLIISCCLLLFGIYASFWSRPSRWADKLMVYDISIFFMEALKLWDFLLALFLLCSIIWIDHDIIFIKLKKFFNSFSLFFHWPSYYWVDYILSTCSTSMCMYAFCCFCWYWISALVLCSPIEYHGLILLKFVKLYG